MYCQFPGAKLLMPRNALYIGILSRFTINNLPSVVNYFERTSRSLAEIE